MGLTTSPGRLKQIRKSRLQSLGEEKSIGYVNDDLIEEEIIAAKKIFNRNKWPVIDVTRKSIEETAAAVLNLLRQFKERRGA